MGWAGSEERRGSGREEEWEEWTRRENRLIEYVERVTKTPQEEQEKLLRRILETNANTEYLLRHGLNGRTDVASFKKCLPIIDYEAIRADVKRIADGDKSPILFAAPVTELLASSGTTGGQRKLFPSNDEDSNLRGLAFGLMRPILNRDLPGLEKGKALFFYFIREPLSIQGDIVTQTAVSSFIKSPAFRDRPFDPSYRLTSPDAVITAYDNDAAMYGHLLCGLIQREEVLRLGSIFVSGIVIALQCLRDWYPELCEDLATGQLSANRIRDPFVREAILKIHVRRNVELADFIRSECSKKSWDGIIRRLWPNVVAVDTVVTGTMVAYLPFLEKHSGGLPIICTQMYAASEGYFGINMNPTCHPKDIAYALFPTVAFYELLPIQNSQRRVNGALKKTKSVENEIVDLADAEVGTEYELIVTTVAGLYRFRLGDVLRAVGYYNSTPQFEFVRRTNVILSVNTDKTDEKELSDAVASAVKLLEIGVHLLDYTSAVDWCSDSGIGHYVIYWELVPSDLVISCEAMEKCCAAIEASLSPVYRHSRHTKFIGPLEIRVLKAGTFELITKHALLNGATLSQYKTPRSLRSASLLSLVNSQVVQKYYSQFCS